MALAPARPCPVEGCPNLDCTAHQVDAWRTRSRPIVTRIRGRALQRRRAELFQRSPWCVTCLTVGRQTRATIRDHIVPLAEGGTEDDSNIQALCLDCSDHKTEGESQRGVARSSLTPRFRKSATPRDQTGRFRPRHR